MENFEIYDVVTKQTITINSILGISRSLGLTNQALRRLRMEHLGSYKPKGYRSDKSCKFSASQGRYILPRNKIYIFTLVEMDTDIEYDCIINKTLSIHLGKKCDELELSRITALRAGKGVYACVYGKVFYLKGNKPKEAKNTSSVSSIYLNSLREKQRINKRIASNLSNRLSKSFKYLSRGQVKKSFKTKNILGIPFDDFIKYIESKFTKGMTWQNYGEWHVDHIIPCTSFDLLNMDDILKCFHYTNLQPLWATTKIAIKYGETEDYVGNIEKGNSIKEGVSQDIL